MGTAVSPVFARVQLSEAHDGPAKAAASQVEASRRHEGAYGRLGGEDDDKLGELCAKLSSYAEAALRA